MVGKQTALDILTLADAVRAGDADALARLAAAPIIPRNDNLVGRPWAGQQLCAYKGLPLSPQQRWGEAFEICAFDDDEEARAHPSIIEFADGSEIGLPELLAAAGPAILGDALVASQGCQLPLLPKTLNIGELLSVHIHGEGQTEAYVIIDAAEGATIRLGFKRDIDPADLGSRLEEGCRLQQQLLDNLAKDIDLEALQSVLASNFARRDSAAESALAALQPWLRADGREAVVEKLRALKSLYWHVLDLLNEIPVFPGQVIHNANPIGSGSSAGGLRSTEIHALGNPEGREILALEIRQPGPTYRFWDHVRYPPRPIKIEQTLRAARFQATTSSDFIATPEPLPDCPGIARSVRDAHFVVDHVRPQPGRQVMVPGAAMPQTLHVIRGEVAIANQRGETCAVLPRGRSALIPVAMGAYQITSADNEAEVVRVSLPTARPHQSNRAAGTRRT